MSTSRIRRWRIPKLPSNLSIILRDLADMQVRVRDGGGDFVLSSFFWLVFEGMRLDPVRDRMLFDYLNTHYSYCVMNFPTAAAAGSGRRNMDIAAGS